MARLSWAVWLVTYQDKCPAPELNPDTVTHLSTNWARRMLTSLIETNALYLYARPPHGLPLRQTTTLSTSTPDYHMAYLYARPPHGLSSCLKVGGCRQWAQSSLHLCLSCAILKYSADPSILLFYRPSVVVLVFREIFCHLGDHAGCK